MKKIAIAALISASFVSAVSANNQDETKKEPQAPSLFTDQQDGAFDVSDFLASKKGFLPVPMIITGPTFGFGGALNVMFLHDSLMAKKNKSGHYIPPSMSGIVAGGTENGTKFGAAYHLGFYLDGNLRSTSFIGHPDMNMDFGSQIGNVSLNTNGYVAYQELKYRVLESNLFAGLNYTYMQIETSPNDAPKPIEHLFNEIGESRYAGLAAVLEYDTRDSIFTPNKGLYAKAVVDFYNEAVGSDKDFINYRLKAFYFTQPTDKFVLGLRSEFQTISGDDKAPAFMTPSILLRGMSTHQHQGQTAFLAEVEGRYEVFSRHWGLAFAGTGKAYGDYSSAGESSFSDADWNGSYGVGYRYELARKFKLLAGFDIAKSETDTAFYITMGSAWNAFY